MCKNALDIGYILQGVWGDLPIFFWILKTVKVNKKSDVRFFCFFWKFRLYLGSIYFSSFIIQIMTIKTQDNKQIPLIKIKDMSRGYPDSKRQLFKHFNFELGKGDFTVITGKSGSGKSTLVKILIGQLRPYKNTVFYKMEDMALLGDEEIQRYRRKIWTIFQDYELIYSLSPQENIIYPLLLEEVPLAQIKKKYDAVKTLLDLSSIEISDIRKLSWGEKQKVAMARAIIHAPDFIIADEPTGNLDHENTIQIADILIKANKIGNTIVLVTHDEALLDYLKLNTEIKMIQLG